MAGLLTIWGGSYSLNTIIPDELSAGVDSSYYSSYK